MNTKWAYLTVIILALFLIFFFARMGSSQTGDDSIDLRDGTTIYGEVIAQNASQLYVATDDGVQKINIRDVKTIHFGPHVSIPTVQPEPSEKS